jgi:hypothetical protein
VLDLELDLRPGRIGRPPLDRRLRLGESAAHFVSFLVGSLRASRERLPWGCRAACRPLPRAAPGRSTGGSFVVRQSSVVSAYACGLAPNRLPRGRPCARGHAHARRRPRPQDLDHPADDELGVTVSAPESDRFNYDKAEPARPHRGRDRRARGGRARVRRRDHGCGERHPSGDAARAEHGRPVRDERRDRLRLHPAPGRGRVGDVRLVAGLRAHAAARRRRGQARRRGGTRRGDPAPHGEPRPPRRDRRGAAPRGRRWISRRRTPPPGSLRPRTRPHLSRLRRRSQPNARVLDLHTRARACETGTCRPPLPA